MFERVCPKCNKKIIYTTQGSVFRAEKRMDDCRSCVSKEIMNRPEIRKSFISPMKRAEVRKKISGDKNGNWRPRGKEYTKWQEYKLDVWKITRQQPLHCLENFDKRGKRKYHLDHITSICEGFKKGIPVDVIANIKNLQMLWWKDNLHKKKGNK